MPRTKGGVKHAKKKKNVMKAAKGFRGGPGTLYRSAIESTMRAKRFATRDRQQKKRHFRSLWIVRLNAAVRERGIAYNRFIPATVAAGIELNRKMLSDLAIEDPAAFDAVIELVRPHVVAMPKKNNLENRSKDKEKEPVLYLKKPLEKEDPVSVLRSFGFYWSWFDHSKTTWTLSQAGRHGERLAPVPEELLQPHDLRLAIFPAARARAAVAFIDTWREAESGGRYFAVTWAYCAKVEPLLAVGIRLLRAVRKHNNDLPSVANWRCTFERPAEGPYTPERQGKVKIFNRIKRTPSEVRTTSKPSNAASATGGTAEQWAVLIDLMKSATSFSLKDGETEFLVVTPMGAGEPKVTFVWPATLKGGWEDDLGKVVEETVPTHEPDRKVASIPQSFHKMISHGVSLVTK